MAIAGLLRFLDVTCKGEDEQVGERMAEHNVALEEADVEVDCTREKEEMGLAVEFRPSATPSSEVSLTAEESTSASTLAARGKPFSACWTWEPN